MKSNTRRTFQFFWMHMKRYKTLEIVLLACMVAGVLSGLVIPYFLKRFFDALVSGQEVNIIADQLIHIIFIIIAFEMIQWAFWRVSNFGNGHLYGRIMANIYDECFEYIQKHSYNFFNNSFIGSLVKKVNRLVRAFESISDKIFYDMGPLLIRVVVIFSVLFWLHPIIGIIMLSWTFVFLVFNYWFSMYKLKYNLARAAADTAISASLADSMTNNVNIKFFSALEYEFARFRKVTVDWFKKARMDWRISEVADALQILLMIFLEFAVLYFAVRFWEEGVLTVGDFVWIQTYLIDLFRQLWNFGRVIRDVYAHLADAEEMIVILNTPHEISDAEGAQPICITHGKIEFNNVCFSYGDSPEVVHKLNLKIKSGEKAALIGPSGGGKSTVAKLILRLFDVSKGQILIDGQSISKVTQDSLHRQIGFVPQDPILFHRTLMENIRYGCLDASDEDVIKAAKLAHCHEFIMKFPHRYDTYVGERGVKLSGGERQRVAIARAILANAPILILDEATSSLDSESEMLIQEALVHLMKQKTTIVIAHRLSTIMKMDRIVVLQGGKVVEEGTHAELVSEKSGLYKKLWDLQVGGYVDE